MYTCTTLFYIFIQIYICAQLNFLFYHYIAAFMPPKFNLNTLRVWWHLFFLFWYFRFCIGGAISDWEAWPHFSNFVVGIFPQTWMVKLSTKYTKVIIKASSNQYTNRYVLKSVCVIFQIITVYNQISSEFRFL